MEEKTHDVNRFLLRVDFSQLQALKAIRQKRKAQQAKMKTIQKSYV